MLKTMKDKTESYRLCFYSMIGIILLFAYAKCKAQPAPFEIFIEMGIDPKMAIAGPYEDTNGGTFNAEFKTGFEWSRQRIGFGYEVHSFINYEKFSLFYDQKFNVTNDERIKLYLGAELSAIKRTWDELDIVNYREKTTTLGNYGFNAMMLYSINWKKNPTGFQIGFNLNAFRGETEYKKHQSGYFRQFRTDAMIIIKRNF